MTTNTDIELQKQLKAKYGVSFTKNMGVSEMLEAWDRVPPEIKSSLPTAVQLSMTTAKAAYDGAVGAVTLRSVYSPLKSTYETVKVALDAATSAVFDAGATAAAEVATQAPKAAEVVADTLVQQQSSIVFGVLDSYV